MPYNETCMYACNSDKKCTGTACNSCELKPELHTEESLQDYMECINDYLDGTMAV